MTDLEAETESQQDPRIAPLMDNVFLGLVGEGPNRFYEDETQVRSASSSDTVDVRLGDQWYRISATPIPEPISLEGTQRRTGMTTPPHAHASDLPGWPCPPRVRDIVKTEGSWGWISVVAAGLDNRSTRLAQDEMGRLWVNGDIVPQFKVPNDSDHVPGAVVFWTVQGIGLYVHPKSYQHLQSLNSWDMQPDQWVPVVSVAATLPDFEPAATERGEQR